MKDWDFGVDACKMSSSVPKALAIFINALSEGLPFLCSNILMADKLTPARAASSCCVMFFINLHNFILDCNRDSFSAGERKSIRMTPSVVINDCYHSFLVVFFNSCRRSKVF